MRIRQGRPPTRFTPDTLMASRLGHTCDGLSVGPDTTPALTPGQWFLSISTIAPTQFSIACQFFSNDDIVMAMDAMAGAADVSRVVSGGGGLAHEDDETDDWQLVETTGKLSVASAPPDDEGHLTDLTQGSDLLAMSPIELRCEIEERGGEVPAEVVASESETLAGILFPLLPPAGIPYRPARVEHSTSPGTAAAGTATSGFEDPPEWLLCPISYQLFEDPVFTADGQTYERASIVQWFEQGKQTSPLTNLSLPHTKLVPNFAMRRMVQGFLAAGEPPKPSVMPAPTCKERAKKD